MRLEYSQRAIQLCCSGIFFRSVRRRCAHVLCKLSGKHPNLAILPHLRPTFILLIPSCNESLSTRSYTMTSKHTLEVTTSVAAAEKLLNTTWNNHVNTATKQSVHRAGAYTIPSQVSGSIAALFSVHGLPLPPRVRQIGGKKKKEIISVDSNSTNTLIYFCEMVSVWISWSRFPPRQTCPSHLKHRGPFLRALNCHCTTLSQQPPHFHTLYSPSSTLSTY